MAEKDIPILPQVPVQGSSHIKNKNGLKIFKYYSSLSNYDKLRAKNVMILG